MSSPTPGDITGEDRRTLPRVAGACAVAVALLALAVLAGWVLDVERIKSVAPGLATMKVNTALSLLALALAVLLRRRPPAVLALAGLVLVVTTLTGLEYLSVLDPHIDELLVDDPESSGLNQPGRMSIAALASLLTLAAALVLLDRGRARVAQALLAVPAGISSLALLGYGFDVEELYRIVSYSTLALHTAVAIALLTVAVAALVPEGVLAWAALDRGVGAAVVRRMVPVAVLGLPLIGALALLGEDNDVFGARFGHALMAAGAALVLVLATWSVARQLDVMDAARASATRDLQVLNASLREGRDAEWRRAEDLTRRLEQEHADFQRAIGRVDDLLWTMTNDPDGSLRLVFASPNAEGVLGGPLPDDLAELDVQRLLSDTVPEQDRPVYRAFLDELSEGRPAEAEFRMVGADGVTRWIWARGAPRHEGGQVFYDGISTNVTERHLLAEQQEALLLLEQEQVRQLKEIDRLRDEFLAVTGHELRTPLTSIRGYAELLQHDEALNERQRDHVSVIVKRAHQLGQLVEDLFDLTRISAGLSVLEPVRLDVFEAVADAIDAHAQEAKEAGLTVNTSLETGLVVSADPVRVRQVLDNLLSNAVKYATEHGHIVVTTRRTDDSALIEVADDGIGIPEEELDHVFDRLYRGSTARERGIRGTGLGLAVCKAVVEAHGGSIGALRNDGGGTVFRVLLPLAPDGPLPITEA